MRVLICWTRISGYMAACWKRLAEQPGIDLRVVAWATSARLDSVDFDESIADGLNIRLLSPDQRADADVVRREIAEHEPDVVVISGWISKSWVKPIAEFDVDRPSVVMGMDTPWKGSLRQHLARWRHRPLLKNVDHVVVAGERTWQYARRLGFKEGQILRGVYAWDEDSFGGFPRIFEPRPNNRSFVFAGRMAPEKGVRTLVDAYRRYRDLVSHPWSMTVCGTGPLAAALDGVPGIDSLGFVQPTTLPDVFKRSDVMVLPSHYEPWGVAMAEAMGAGLPVIASEACGAAIDMLKPYWNGIFVPTASVERLSEALHWFHRHEERLAAMSENARKAAEPYSASAWATRWSEMLTRLVSRQDSATARRAA